MNIGTITCSYYMRIYNYHKPENLDWGKMVARYRSEFHREDFLKLAGEIRQLGYDGIEVWDPTFSHMVYSEEEAAAMGRELKEMGFRRVVYCIGGWSLADKGQVEPAYRFAKALGASVVTGCIVKEGCEELFGEMERCGKQYGIKYAIENHPEPNFEKAEEIAQAFRPYETIGANIDTGIYHMLGYDVLAAAELFGDKIYHVHCKDTVQGGDECFPLGEGTAPIRELAVWLEKRGYQGMVSVEFEYAGDPTEGLASSLALLQDAAKRG